MASRSKSLPSNQLPKNWPPEIPYLTASILSPALAPTHLSALKTRPSSSSTDACTLPTTHVPGPSPLVTIKKITDPNHPAYGQGGLFAARDLKPASFILQYVGVIHTSSPEHEDSDYDLTLDRFVEGKLAIDAAKMGNEARFCNDFRGVPASSPPGLESKSTIPPRKGEQGKAKCRDKSKAVGNTQGMDSPKAAGKAKANAEFREIWDPKRGERGMGVFVLGEGKNGTGKWKGVKKGEEILVSYGKGFWGARREPAEQENDTVGVGEQQEKCGD